MNKNKIKWGIIGCGDVAEVKSGPAFNKVGQSELIAVMRRNGTKAKDFAQRHGVAHWYDDASELLENKEINAVYIATPPSSHVDYALKAIKAGKNIYLEKPVTRTSEEAFKIKEALHGKKNKLVVAHYRRKLQAFLKVKELVDTGMIGEIRLVDLRILQSNNPDLITKTEENWRVNPHISGGGYFYDLAPHQLDLMLTWFGQPEKVAGFSMNQQNIYPANDIVNGMIQFKNGVQFRGVWAFNVSDADSMDRCIIYGSKGSVLFSLFGDEVIVKTGNSTENYRFPAIPHVQQPMIQATVEYFLDQGVNPCPIEDAILGMEIMEEFTSQDYR